MRCLTAELIIYKIYHVKVLQRIKLLASDRLRTGYGRKRKFCFSCNIWNLSAQVEAKKEEVQGLPWVCFLVPWNAPFGVRYNLYTIFYTLF